MSLQYIIDGYNLLNHPSFNRHKKTLQEPAQAILGFIAERRLTGSSKNKVIVVLDGFPPHLALNQDYSDTSVVYSRKIDADEKIKRLVEETANRKNIVVVSDDKEIKFMIRSLGAQWLGVEEFINKGKSKEPQSKRKEPPKQELNYSQMHSITEELKKLWLK